jgi:threonine/homoserine/homoserine lactone efflux protein
MFFGSVFATALPAAPSRTLCVLAVLLIVASASSWYGLLAVMLSHPPVREAYAQRALLLGRVAAVLLGSLAIGLLAGALRRLTP